MLSNLLKAAMVRRAGLISGCLTLMAVSQFAGAGKVPLRNLKLDPKASKVELFDGIEEGLLSTRVVANDITGGNVFIENKTDKPLTVLLPEAIVGVHVLKQFGPAGNANVGVNGLNSGGNVAGGQQVGQGQPIGGGFGTGQQGAQVGNGQPGGAQNNVGQGFFSVPPQQVAQVPFRAVCLEYGKPDPMPKMTYRLLPVDQFTRDKVLQETLRIYGSGRLDYSVAQAATWHLTNKMSRGELASLKKLQNPSDISTSVPVFTTAQLDAADQLLATAKKQATARETAQVNHAVQLKSGSNVTAVDSKTGK